MPATLFSQWPLLIEFDTVLLASGLSPASMATPPLPYYQGAPGPLLCLYSLLLGNPVKVTQLYEYTDMDNSKISISNQAFSPKLQAHFSNCLLHIAT